jgi:hypothetical protein
VRAKQVSGSIHRAYAREDAVIARNWLGTGPTIPNAAMSVHVIAAILRVILNHEDEHIVGALAECDPSAQQDCYFHVMLASFS